MTGNLTRKIVIAGVMSAIAIFLGATHLGFIPWIAGASLTIMAVPVIIGAILEGPIVGSVIGFLFGLFSLLQAAIAPTGPVDIIFTNPLVSILPRLFIGPAAWLVYRALKPANQVLSLVASGIAGSLTNTVLVLTVIGLFGLFPWGLIGTVAVTNGLPEAAAASLITLAVVASWERIEHGRSGSKLDDSKPDGPKSE
ncbi:MAG TPA: ECF transporter S component [Spirochaetia bacterium]|nr:ECF transporter S component [Spirochaetia bacterium]